MQDCDCRSQTGPVALVINGKWVQASQTMADLLMCLYENPGRVVTYEKLCSALGHKSGGPSRFTS
jgi:DNA-binding winged helix-turn-helix (wHTH) protein